MAHITLTPAPGRHVIRAGDTVIGQTDHAIELREGSYNPVLYVPRADVDMSKLTKTDRQTTCPHKGACSYYTVVTPTARLENAVWSYEDPLQSVSAIAGLLAFYADKVQITKA